MSNCKHKDRAAGPRFPLVWGSAATLVCLVCGMWRELGHGRRWRPAAELLIALVNRETP